MPTAMESEVSATLSALRDCMYLKVPDVPRYSGSTMRANIPRPFDYIAFCPSSVVGIECKQSRNRTSFPLSNIHAHQIEALCRMEALSHYSYMLINVRLTKNSPRSNEMFALTGGEIAYWYYIQTDRKSIPVDALRSIAVPVPRIKLPSGRYGWDLRVLPPFDNLDFFHTELRLL